MSGPPLIDARSLVGSHDILFITLDTLRYDVACRALEEGMTPFLAQVLPGGAWERRITPGSFTYAAHQAFFAGFLPVPESGDLHPRLFAARFDGSETTTSRTAVFDAPDIVSGLRGEGYHTICVGGVGFFNRRTPLGSVLPDLFDERWWSPEMGVTDPRSTEHQVARSVASLEALAPDQRCLLFLNVSALHQPNCIYVPGATEDGLHTQAAALAYVDAQLPPLFAAMRRRAGILAIVCSDHGTAYGEGGLVGHRVGHPVVWTVPYAEVVMPRVGP